MQQQKPFRHIERSSTKALNKIRKTTNKGLTDEIQKFEKRKENKSKSREWQKTTKIISEIREIKANKKIQKKSQHI